MAWEHFCFYFSPHFSSNLPKVRHVDGMIGSFHVPPSYLHWLSRPPLPWMGDRRAPFKCRLPGSPGFHYCKISSNIYPSSSPLQVAGGSVGSMMEVTVAERLVWWSLQMRFYVEVYFLEILFLLL